MHALATSCGSTSGLADGSAGSTGAMLHGSTVADVGAATTADPPVLHAAAPAGGAHEAGGHPMTGMAMAVCLALLLLAGVLVAVRSWRVRPRRVPTVRPSAWAVPALRRVLDPPDLHRLSVLRC